MPLSMHDTEHRLFIFGFLSDSKNLYVVVFLWQLDAWIFVHTYIAYACLYGNTPYKLCRPGNSDDYLWFLLYLYRWSIEKACEYIIMSQHSSGAVFHSTMYNFFFWPDMIVQVPWFQPCNVSAYIHRYTRNQTECCWNELQGPYQPTWKGIQVEWDLCIYLHRCAVRMHIHCCFIVLITSSYWFCHSFEMEKILAALASLGLTATVHEHSDCTSHDEHVRWSIKWYFHVQ